MLDKYFIFTLLIDFAARYATPVDALSMLSDDTQELQLIS